MIQVFTPETDLTIFSGVTQSILKTLAEHSVEVKRIVDAEISFDEFVGYVNEFEIEDIQRAIEDGEVDESNYSSMTPSIIYNMQSDISLLSSMRDDSYRGSILEFSVLDFVEDGAYPVIYLNTHSGFISARYSNYIVEVQVNSTVDLDGYIEEHCFG